MSDSDDDRTASLMSPAKLAQLKPRPAASPAAWLDQMAADAGSGHVRRLVELRQQFEAQVRERDYKPAIAALRAAAEAVQPLDFTLLQSRGWLARATGKGREQGAQFAAQAAQAATAVDAAREAVKALGRSQHAQAAAAERGALEFDVELKAIEKILDQGARWLQDMRNQLKARQAAQPDAAAQAKIDEDNARCEILVARLKKLRAATSVVQHLQQEMQAVALRRSGVQQALHEALEGEVAGWMRKAAAVAAAAADGGDASADAGPLQAQHADVVVAIKRAAKDLIELRSTEHALADELAAGAKPLQDAA